MRSSVTHPLVLAFVGLLWAILAWPIGWPALLIAVPFLIAAVITTVDSFNETETEVEDG